MSFAQLHNQFLFLRSHPLAIFLYFPLHFFQLPRVFRELFRHYFCSLLDCHDFVSLVAWTEYALRAYVGILAIKTVVNSLLFMLVTLQPLFLWWLWHSHNRLHSLGHLLSEVLTNKRLQAIDSLTIKQCLDEADLALEGLLLSSRVELSRAV